MAYEIPVLIVAHEAAADLSAKQFYFVKMATGGKVDVCSATTDVPYGVLQNTPLSGAEAEVLVFGLSKVSSDAALAVGNLVGPAADGQAAAYTAGSDTTKYILGQVVLASSAADEYATALICGVPHRDA
jgi:hypothetical protein